MTAADSKDVVLERHLAAPIDLVWSMWTEPEHFAAWYGPAGARIPSAELDVRVGGARRVTMAMDTPDGPMEMQFVGEFVEIDAPFRLVYTEAVAGPDGSPSSPMTRVIVELSPYGNGTALTLTHEGVPADSPGATGWNMALDTLETHAANASA